MIKIGHTCNNLIIQQINYLALEEIKKNKFIETGKMNSSIILVMLFYTSRASCYYHSLFRILIIDKLT